MVDQYVLDKAAQQGNRLASSVNREISDLSHSDQELLLISALVISGALGMVTARLSKEAAKRLWDDMRNVIDIGHAQIEAAEQGTRH
ncbi:hypothetical protein L2Y94_06525 [Luteibacter aegosomatis]|uniref:hypothetical protein n=1 Tax=Luteibacter aegosomatis TaxID=2911537 RepID=UPI001FFBE722|nr:hypothetical protein [Luteibacter aegosomatis]UPG87006.1 hypothetical protein L2Y94_06525 [Luteibacter aegosomatis]